MITFFDRETSESGKWSAFPIGEASAVLLSRPPRHWHFHRIRSLWWQLRNPFHLALAVSVDYVRLEEPGSG